MAIRLPAADRIGADKHYFGRICRRAQGWFVIQHLPVNGGTSNTPGLDRLSPWFLNLFENKLTVQFEHRILTIATALVLIAWYFARRRMLHEPVIKISFKLVGLMVVIQVFLGIATLLLQVPVWLGAMHWAGALLLFGAMLFNVHALS